MVIKELFTDTNQVYHRFRHFCAPLNRTLQHVGRCCIDIVSGMTSHEQLDRFIHFCKTHGCVLWSPHVDGSCQWINRIWMMSHDHLDRFCHFYTPFNRSIIGSAVLHIIQSAYTACIVYHGLKYRHATRPEPWSHPWPFIGLSLTFRHAWGTFPRVWAVSA